MTRINEPSSAPASILSNEEALHLVENASRRASFAARGVEEASSQIVRVAHLIADALASGGKLLVFGNGGSAACAQHFAAEFTGKLSLDRRPYPALALTVDTSAITAIANDFGYEEVFARQVRALATQSDVVIGLSTSGKSINVQKAIADARSLGAATVALTGMHDDLGADHAISVPLGETARIQEAHDLVLHQVAQIAERLISPMADDASADRFPFILADGQLVGLRSWATSSGRRLVSTNGVFDVLHEGHLSSLRQARGLGDMLVVLVNSDESVRTLKGPSRPIRALHERLSDLRRVVDVDHVAVMPDADPRRMLELLAPDIHAKGADYVSRGVVERATVERHGGEIAYLELLEGYSTTDLERKVRGESR